MITHIKKQGSYNVPLCGWDRKHPESTTVCTTGNPDCPDCLALPKPEPYAMRRDKMCCDCEHTTRIRGVPWVKLCSLHAAAPDLLEAVRAALEWIEEETPDYQQGTSEWAAKARRVDGLRAAISKASGEVR